MLTVRISQLNSWMTCEGLAMSYLDEFEEQSPGGPAAHTGTAIGRAIELFHKQKLEGGEPPDLNDIFKQVEGEADGKSGATEHPFERARWQEVYDLLLEYAQDPRNNEVLVIPEISVSFILDRPAGSIKFTGTADQLRISNRVMSVWDMKNGSKSGSDMLGMYWAQLYGYTYGVAENTEVLNIQGLTSYQLSQVFDSEVSLGGVMRLQEYIHPLPRAGRKVFWPMETSMSSIRTALERIADRILEVYHAKSRALLKPGIHCSWCPHGSHNVCVHLV